VFTTAASASKALTGNSVNLSQGIFGQQNLFSGQKWCCDLRANEYAAYSRRQLLANAAIVASRVDS
jgi:hypothetical protein